MPPPADLHLSGEFLLPHCGLAHYLELLVRSLAEARPGAQLNLRATGPLWDTPTPHQTSSEGLRAPHLVRPGVRDFILQHIEPRLPRALWNGVLRAVSSVHYLRAHRAIAGWWRRQPVGAPVLLPHIPLDPSVTAYYRALMAHRLVWVIHDLHPFYFPEAWGEPAHRMCRTVLPELARRARRIIVHNDFTRDSAVRHLGADPARMTVVRLPPILDPPPPGDPAADAALLAGLGIRPPYALWASSTTIAHKNHERLLRAWAEVQRRHPQRLQLVCSGNRQPRWREVEPVLRSVADTCDVVFTDTVPKATLHALLRNAELAVCPTLFEGGGCGPAMEANLVGVPVVCSDIPQIREQFDGREDLCRFFNPREESSLTEAVLAALADPAETARRAARAKEWIRTRRTWADVAREYWSVLDAARTDPP
jgi:glycosyltransferase involved in cell wall biosynthesis